MTARERATLSIRIDIRDQTRIVVLDEHNIVKVDVTTEFSRSQLDDIHDPLREDLDKFRTALALPEQISFRTVCESLLSLQARGRNILINLFKGKTRERKETIILCQRACENWAKPGWPRPPLITVHMTGASGIPIEMLPLLESTTPAEFRGDLERIAASFLGFSAIVKREIAKSAIGEGPFRLENDPRLPIKMFISRDLGGAIEDERYLKTNSAIELDTAWPLPGRTPALPQFCAELAEHLWRADCNIAGDSRNPPVQICHVSCHCDTTKRSSMKYSLTFYRKPFIGKREVTLETLLDKLSALRDDQDEAGTRSLIIMNACGSAGLYPSGASSFPDLFLGNDFGFVGFIGSEATVPDGFANIFTKTFYNNLLQDALPLGRALHKTRWDILRSNRNPLAIIYSLYADPEIRVIRPKAQ